MRFIRSSLGATMLLVVDLAVVLFEGCWLGWGWTGERGEDRVALY